jgi:hypothetical protein
MPVFAIFARDSTVPLDSIRRHCHFKSPASDNTAVGSLQIEDKSLICLASHRIHQMPGTDRHQVKSAQHVYFAKRALRYM